MESLQRRDLLTGLTDFGNSDGYSGDNTRFVADINGDGRDDILAFKSDGVYVAASTSLPGYVAADFDGDYKVINRTFGTSSWDHDMHPTAIGDVNGDGKADIVGFGYAGVYVAESTSSEYSDQLSFATPRLVLQHFRYDQGWRLSRHPRMLADINGDGKQDIVGFGYAGPYVSLAIGQPGKSAEFSRPQLITSSSNSYTYGYRQGWTVNGHPRVLADVNGDGKDDIVGFGDDGVIVSISKSTATWPSFHEPSKMLTSLSYNLGWRGSEHPRMVGDINGDGKADLIGFGANNKVFAEISSIPADYGTKQHNMKLFGHKVTSLQDFMGSSTTLPLTSQNPRMVDDVDGDGMGDLIVFANDGVYVGLSQGDGTFQNGFVNKESRLYFRESNYGPDVAPQPSVRNFGYSAGGWRVGTHKRMTGDFDGDGAADILGFGSHSAFVKLDPIDLTHPGHFFGTESKRSCTFDAPTGVLSIQGGKFDDQIYVSHRPANDPSNVYEGKMLLGDISATVTTPLQSSTDLDPNQKTFCQINDSGTIGGRLRDKKPEDANLIVNQIIIKGHLGNDRIELDGAFDSSLHAGKVQIFGGAGNDVIQGGDGPELIYGEWGVDSIDGGKGNDTIYGGPGNDVIDGGADRDRIYGGAHDDQLFGNDGGDWIYGESGHDRLTGGKGDDYLIDGPGRDQAWGGTGVDKFYNYEINREQDRFYYQVGERFYSDTAADVLVADDPTSRTPGGPSLMESDALYYTAPLWFGSPFGAYALAGVEVVSAAFTTIWPEEDWTVGVGLSVDIAAAAISAGGEFGIYKSVSGCDGDSYCEPVHNRMSHGVYAGIGGSVTPTGVSASASMVLTVINGDANVFSGTSLTVGASIGTPAGWSVSVNALFNTDKELIGVSLAIGAGVSPIESPTVKGFGGSVAAGAAFTLTNLEKALEDIVAELGL